MGRQVRIRARAVGASPERTLRGASLPHDSIQVGLGRTVISRFVEAWTCSIEDLTGRVRKMRRLLEEGRGERATRLLPPESVYPVPPELARRLGMRSPEPEQVSDDS